MRCYHSKEEEEEAMRRMEERREETHEAEKELEGEIVDTKDIGETQESQEGDSQELEEGEDEPVKKKRKNKKSKKADVKSMMKGERRSKAEELKAKRKEKALERKKAKAEAEKKKARLKREEHKMLLEKTCTLLQRNIPSAAAGSATDTATVEAHPGRPEERQAVDILETSLVESGGPLSLNPFTLEEEQEEDEPHEGACYMKSTMETETVSQVTTEAYTMFQLKMSPLLHQD